MVNLKDPGFGQVKHEQEKKLYMSKSFRVIVAAVVALVLLLGAFSGGVIIGWVIPDRASADFRSQGSPIASENVPGDSQQQTNESLFDPFWEAWDIVHEQFVDQPVDDVALMRGAIRGMLEALGDQHSSYMDPYEYEQNNMPMNGEYEGIGAWVDITGEYLTITSPMPDSPAEKAGLKPGDMIIAVNGEDMTGVDGNLVLRQVLGPAGTDVVLTIVRETEDENGITQTGDPFDVTITRAKITLKSVEYEMLENDIAYINLTTFGERSTDELKLALRDLLKQNPQGLILDLRNNGGGYLQTAIEVTSQFIDEGVLMYQVYGDGSRDTYEAIPGGLATEIPMVVLVNEGSASASEITAGAIQDLGRAQLVGVTTYGKGSVQNWIPLENGNEGAVRVTIARWLTPDGRQIHEVGLEPDVVVELTEEDFEAERDPQLDKAIELLSQ